MAQPASFTFEIPVRMIFGVGVSERIGEEAKQVGMKKVLIVTDEGIRNCGILEKIETSLRKRQVEVNVFDGVEINPGSGVVEKGKRAYRENGCDALIAVGGGACLDAAKAIGVMLTNEGRIEDYDFGRKQVKNSIPSLITVTSTAGTGSEINFWSVITDSERKVKMNIGSPLMSPKLALVDPELTVTLPRDLTAAMGMDALTHAIEGYVSLSSSPVTDALALQAIRVISRNLPKAVANGKNTSARYNTLLGSVLAGMVDGNAGCGNAHAIGAVLGGYYNAPHGILNAVLLPYVMEFNLIALPEKFVEIAKAMGETTEGLSLIEAAEKAVKVVRNLSENIGISRTLREVAVGMKKEDIPKVAEVALADMNSQNNPRVNKVQDLIQIMGSAW